MNSMLQRLRCHGLFLLLLGVAPFAFAAEPVAQVTTLIGTADVVRAIGGGSETLSRKSEIYLDDTIKTGNGARLKLLLKDRSIIKIGPNSEVVIDKVRVAGQSDRSAIKLLKGRLRSVIGEKLSQGDSYEITTTVAVAGVRGTDFEVAILGSGDEERTAVRTYEGIVALASRDPAIAGSVLIHPGHYSVVHRGLAPQEPSTIEGGEDLGQVALHADGSTSAEEMNSSLLWSDALDQLEAGELPSLESDTLISTVEEQFEPRRTGAGSRESGGGDSPALSPAEDITRILLDESFDGVASGVGQEAILDERLDTTTGDAAPTPVQITIPSN